MKYNTLLLLSASLVTTVLADQPFVRYNTGCQLLLNNTRIYCYSGGYTKTVNTDITPLPDHYYLDVSKDFVVPTSYNSWTRVIDPPNFTTEETFGYVSVKLSDTSVLINGGTGINNGKDYMKNQTVIYHADQNQWETVQNTSSFPQSYYGSGALALNNTVVFWGGAAAIGALLPTFNGTAKLLVSEQSIKWSLQANSIAPGNTRYGHTATADASGKLIYYFGGRDVVRDPVTGVYTRPYSTFSNLLIYHTDTAVWQSKTAASSVVPSNRMSHTANLIPNSDTILIYGGAGPDSVGNRIPSTDYIYTYNATSNVIQPISIPASSVGAGARYGHSAVIRNNSLFILFGIDFTLLATSDFHVLNLDTYTWKTNYYVNETAPNDTNSTIPNGNGTSSSGDSSHSSGNSSGGDSGGMSSGAIAGIVIAVVAVIAIILAFLFIRRRKQKKAAAEQYPTYWDVTSINNKMMDSAESDVPITSTGPVDISKLPGYTTCRTGLPTNIINDKDVNPPPSSNPKVLLTGAAAVGGATTDPSSLPPNAASTDTYTAEQDTKKVWPPDAQAPNIITPSVPVEHVKPDVGKEQ